MREKLIDGYNGVYKITENGDVYSGYKYKISGLGDKWIKLKPVLDKGVGYYLVTLVQPKTKKRKNVFIHRLLALHFIPNPENKCCVNHKDGNKTNNSLNNLEWVTIKENNQHAQANGLVKVPTTEVLKIDKNTNEVLEEYPSITEAAKQNNLHTALIGKVCRGERKTTGDFKWRYKEGTFRPKPAKISTLRKPLYQIDITTGDIIKEFYSIKEAAEYFNTNHSNISRTLRYNKVFNGYKFIYKDK